MDAARGAAGGRARFLAVGGGRWVFGMLKYLRRNPVPRVTIAGGFGKLTKLAQGFLDLHSGRSQVDFTWLADRLAELEAPAGAGGRGADSQYRKSGAHQSHRRRSAACRSGRGAGA